MLYFFITAEVFNCAGRNGTFPHPLDTSKFIQCSDGIKVIMNCPEGQVFDNISKFCDWKSSTLYALGWFILRLPNEYLIARMSIEITYKCRQILTVCGVLV